MDYQVTCVTKPNRLSTHEHITAIGNGRQKWSREDAIRKIESNTDTFYTVDRTTGKRAYVGVVKETGKNPFLRTHADGKWNDNLLALDECS